MSTVSIYIKGKDVPRIFDKVIYAENSNTFEVREGKRNFLFPWGTIDLIEISEPSAR